jgi:hypothetical protein
MEWPPTTGRSNPNAWIKGQVGNPLRIRIIPFAIGAFPVAARIDQDGVEIGFQFLNHTRPA